MLINYDEYERLKDTLDVLSDADLMKQIDESRKFYAKGGRGESFETVCAESLVPRKRRKR